MMQVRATQRGFYGTLLRRPGDVFTLASAEHFSARWMEPVSSDTPDHRTSAQQALRVQQERHSPLGATRPVCPRVEPDADRPVDHEFDPFP
jgi:hypothetical protein